MKFTSHGFDYETDQHGVLCQINPQPYIYDEKYVATYDTPEYVAKNKALQLLRIGFVIASHGKEVDSLLDFGCGNGAFLAEATDYMGEVVGYDIAEGKMIKDVFKTDFLGFSEVYTFWDALEHVHDLEFIRTLPCKTICVSLPYCHMNEIRRDQAWFDKDYKHRKPNEHVRHFTPESLSAMMEHYGWKAHITSFHEDIVRQSTHGLENILSMSFKKK